MVSWRRGKGKGLLEKYFEVLKKCLEKTDEMTSELRRSVRDEMLHAAVNLLDNDGPDALQTRKVTSAAGTSTMAVYTHFGGMRSLDRGGRR